jgi:putative Mg2+ transporter-C (MgtC) family protein
VTPLTSFESTEQLNAVLVPFVVRCGAAALCGGLIGIERELKGKPAGFRTNILICVGACIYMLAGVFLLQVEGNDPAAASRLGAQIVTGIGFLGAGSIIRSGGHVTGLTSAATIWVVAAIGLVAGAGFPIVAVVAAVLVFATLVALRGVEARYLDPHHPDDRFPNS